MTGLYISVLICMALKSEQDKQSLFIFSGKFIRQKALLAETFPRFSELSDFFSAD